MRDAYARMTRRPDRVARLRTGQRLVPAAADCEPRLVELAHAQPEQAAAGRQAEPGPVQLQHVAHCRPAAACDRRATELLQLQPRSVALAEQLHQLTIDDERLQAARAQPAAAAGRGRARLQAAQGGSFIHCWLANSPLASRLRVRLGLAIVARVTMSRRRQSRWQLQQRGGTDSQPGSR